VVCGRTLRLSVPWSVTAGAVNVGELHVPMTAESRLTVPLEVTVSWPSEAPPAPPVLDQTALPQGGPKTTTHPRPPYVRLPVHPPAEAEKLRAADEVGTIVSVDARALPAIVRKQAVASRAATAAERSLSMRRTVLRRVRRGRWVWCGSHI
jgi:hypothetical protein